MKEVIKEILELAVNAPSGHNSQPWRFIVKGESVFVWNIPDKDKILFNYKQRGSLVAHGALIENIVIIASEKRYQADVFLFPRKDELDLIAEINFTKDENSYQYGHLYPSITKRATNRKPYRVVPLMAGDEKSLKTFSKSMSGNGFDIIFFQDRDIIKKLAYAFSMGDRLIFENPYVHQALFSNVNWTLKEEQKKREGLYMGTKELSFFEKLLFRYLLSNWNIVKNLQIVSLSEKAALKRQKLYERCSVMGMIVAPGDSPEDFIKSGRILQRLWLTATSLGLSFQPVSVGLLYLGQRVQVEKPDELTENQIKFVRDAYREILITSRVKNIPTFSFRIGYSDPPTASSLKKPPEIIYE